MGYFRVCSGTRWDSQRYSVVESPDPAEQAVLWGVLGALSGFAFVFPVEDEQSGYYAARSGEQQCSTNVWADGLGEKLFLLLQFYAFAGTMVITFAVVTLLTLGFEAPMLKMEGILVSRLKKMRK